MDRSLRISTTSFPPPSILSPGEWLSKILWNAMFTPRISGGLAKLAPFHFATRTALGHDGRNAAKKPNVFCPTLAQSKQNWLSWCHYGRRVRRLIWIFRFGVDIRSIHCKYRFNRKRNSSSFVIFPGFGLYVNAADNFLFPARWSGAVWIIMRNSDAEFKFPVWNEGGRTAGYGKAFNPTCSTAAANSQCALCSVPSAAPLDDADT